MALPASPFLGMTGISGPVYRIDPATGSVLLDDSNLPIALDASGFYTVDFRQLNLVKQSVNIRITPYQSKKKFIKYPERSSYGGTPIVYIIDNRDQVLDEAGNLVTPGKFDTFFGRSVVRANGTCEMDQALALVMTLDGTSTFQATFPVNFTTMTTTNITQAQINNALA